MDRFRNVNLNLISMIRFMESEFRSLVSSEELFELEAVELADLLASDGLVGHHHHHRGIGFFFVPFVIRLKRNEKVHAVHIYNHTVRCPTKKPMICFFLTII